MSEHDVRTVSARMDEFVNAVAGMGDPGRDKATHTVFVPDFTLNRQTLNALYKSSWLAKRIVNITAADACSNWWKLEDPEQDEIVQAEVKRLDARRKVQKALSWCNLYGESAILINEESAGTTDAPIESLRRITSLTVAAGGEGSRELKVARDELTGNIIGFVYYPRNTNLAPIEYDPSRVLYLRQEDMPTEILAENSYCSYSALQVVWGAVKRYGVAMQSGENYAYERSFIHYKIKGIGAGPGGLNNVVDTFQSAIQRIIQAKGIYRAIVTGDRDELQAFDANFGGWGEFIETLMYEVSGAAYIPVTKLFEMSPGGMNATGEFDMKNYHERIRNKEQNGILRHPMEQLVSAIMIQSMGPFDGQPQPFGLEFNPLSVPTEEEREQVKTSMFNRLFAAVREGVLLASEVRPALFAQGNEDGITLDETAFAAEAESRQSLANAITNRTTVNDDLLDEEGEELDEPEQSDN